MSEEKRVTLISFGPQKDNVKKKSGNSKTVRICLVLPESNEDTYPEFNYKEELAALKKKDVHKNAKSPAPVTNGLSNLDEDDDDVKRIAREMEAKYGTRICTKKSKKGKKDDYADIGMGYDESDSFIDNTDGYDEMIPPNVTTLHGGFYVNCGALEFKARDDASEESSSSDSDVPERIAATKKRILESSDESEGEKETDNSSNVEKSKPSDGTNDIQKPKKKICREDRVKPVKKLEKQKKSATVRELLIEKRIDLDMSIPPDLMPTDIIDDGKELKENKQPLSSAALADINDTIESVVKGSDEVNNKVQSKESKESSEFKPSDEVVKLPEFLPRDVLNLVNTIKETAENTSDEKLTHFTASMKELFLRLESSCKVLGKPSKIKIYEYLAPFLKCKREVLMKRAKSIALENEQSVIQRLMINLKDKVDAIMPSVLDNYSRESQKVLMKKFSKEGAENEETKSLRLPHRRFPWSEDTKKSVRDIILSRKKCLILEGKKKDTLDSRIKEFVEKELRLIWPEGWMSITSLSKVCGLTPDSSTAKPVNAVKNKPLKKTVSNSNNSSLSITPVTNATTSKPKINNNNSDNVKKSLSALPEIEISKTLPVAPPKEINNRTITPEKPDATIEIIKQPKPPEIKNNSVEIIPKIATPEVINAPQDLVNKSEESKPVDHCQVIDLTCQNELKRKPGPKSKNKYYADSDNVKKVKSARDEITGSFALDQIIADSLVDPNYSAANAKDFSVNLAQNYSAPSVDFPKIRTTSEGDDIQKVMEGLKALQKMSSPIKSEGASTSSPVSVIAYNKSYSPKSAAAAVQQVNAASNSAGSKTDFCTGFQDVFQKHFLNDGVLKASQSLPASTKAAYNNSLNKYPHIANSGSSGSHLPSEKHVQSSNNNHDQQTKIRNALPAQQPTGVQKTNPHQKQ